LTIRGGMGGKNTMKNLLGLKSCSERNRRKRYAQDPVMADYLRNNGFNKDAL